MSDHDDDYDEDVEDDDYVDEDEDVEEEDGEEEDDDYDDEGFDDLAPTAVAVLDTLVQAIVADPDAVEVNAEEGRGRTISLTVEVAQDDLGRVIGKRGRVANAIRAVVRAAAARDDIEVEVEFLD